MCQYFQALSNSTITAEHLRYSGVDNKGPTAIFTAIQGAVSGDTMLWDLLKTQFKDELRMDDFRTSPADGSCAGQTGLWLAVMAWLQEDEEMWNWLSHRFRGELRIDDVVIKPNSGGESILHQVNSAADEGYPVLKWIIDQLNIN